MSADNWGICPKCKQSQVQQIEKLEKSLESKYGKVSAEEYLSIVERLREPREELETTLREDFEVWMDEDGVFNVRYSGHCANCNFKHEFKHREVVLK